PLFKMLERVVGFLDVVRDVHEIGVDDVAAQILPERMAQLVVVFDEQRLERLELRLAPRYRARVAGEKVIALLSDESRIIGLGHTMLLSVRSFFTFSAGHPVRTTPPFRPRPPPRSS